MMLYKSHQQSLVSAVFRGHDISIKLGREWSGPDQYFSELIFPQMLQLNKLPIVHSSAGNKGMYCAHTTTLLGLLICKDNEQNYKKIIMSFPSTNDGCGNYQHRWLQS